VIDAVVKIGGRLGRGERLSALCARLAHMGRSHRILVVPGGGVFADAVRECDARFGLSAGAAHWMAILAMDQYGHLLADLIPASRTVVGVADAAAVAGAGSVAVLLPHALLAEADPLPHSWQVTSDSIAAWVAELVGAPKLVLLKDRVGLDVPVDGVPAATLGRLSVAQLAAWAGVDDHLGELVAHASFDLWILDGDRPERLEGLLESGHTDGLRVVRPAP
jgi:aspartokinase-like uncharacterized kinase